MGEVVPLAMFAFVFVFFCNEYCSWRPNYVQHLPTNVGVYRDDVFAVCNHAPSQVEKVRQELVAGVPGVGPEGHFSRPPVGTA